MFIIFWIIKNEKLKKSFVYQQQISIGIVLAFPYPKLSVMRTQIINFLSLLVLFATSCSKDDDNINNDSSGNPMTFTVDPYSKVEVNGQVKLRFENSANKAANSDYEVHIIATEPQREHIDIVSENGLLTIHTDDQIALDDSVIVVIHPQVIDEITLRSDQVAVFEGKIDQEELHVTTMAKSELYLERFRVGYLFSEQKGQSKLHLDNLVDVYAEEHEYPEENSFLINDTTLMVDNDFIVTGDSVILSDDDPAVYTAYGDQIRKYYLIDHVSIDTKGTSEVYAFHAPVYNLDIELVGSSHAEVWAIDRITGRGVGSSELYYRGSPDISAFELKGTAQIIPWN